MGAQMLEAIAGREEIPADMESGVADMEDGNTASPTQELKSLMATVSLLDSKLANLEDATDSFREPNRGVYASSVLGGNAIAAPQSIAASASADPGAETLLPD